MKKALSIFLILLASFILWKCASQTTPTGGPKDETPPKLTKSAPTNKQTNFKGKKVELTFNELLKLNNAKEEIIITPSPGKEVQFLVKQNKVTIEPKDGWKDSTTYSISFREGIQDLNEGNAAVDLRLAFSTGGTIDSLQISGRISESLSEKIPEKITVALYQEDTFNIFEHTPLFFTKTKTDGTFKIENLKAGNYRIYAFDDKNKNLKVESISEKFGFVSLAIQPQAEVPKKKKIDTLSIALYKIDSRPLKINSIRSSGNITKVKFNKNVTSYKITNPSKVKLYHAYSDYQTEVSIYNELKINDSVKISIHGTDSTLFEKDSTFYIKSTESKQEKEKLTQKIISASFNPETFELQTKTQYSKPIQLLLSDSIYITPDAVPERAPQEKPDAKKKKKESEEPQKTEEKKDTAKIKPILKIAVLPKNISIDSTKNVVVVSTTLDKKMITEKTKQLNVVYEELFVKSVENDTSTRETKSIPIVQEQNTGIIHIEVVTKYKNYEIRLLSPSGEIIKKLKNVKKYTLKYLPAQEYKLMMYADLNNNGEWDCQNITLQTMQEPTFFYKTIEGKTGIPVRSGWELGPLILKF